MPVLLVRFYKLINSAYESDCQAIFVIRVLLLHLVCGQPNSN